MVLRNFLYIYGLHKISSFTIITNLFSSFHLHKLMEVVFISIPNTSLAFVIPWHVSFFQSTLSSSSVLAISADSFRFYAYVSFLLPFNLKLLRCSHLPSIIFSTSFCISGRKSLVWGKCYIWKPFRNGFCLLLRKIFLIPITLFRF